MSKTGIHMIAKGNSVVYNDKKYIVIYVYDSGFCELRKKDSMEVQLVHFSELVLDEKKNT